MLGRRLRSLRLARRWPMKFVAAELGVTAATVCDWENGERFPSGDHLLKLSTCYGMPVCQLMCAGPAQCPLFRGGGDAMACCLPSRARRRRSRR
jgi:transcriptional regulator with XRE-family HTH domain